MAPKIAKVVVGLPVDGPFDYALGSVDRERIEVGQRVRVSFNRRNRVGFVVGSATRSRFKKLNPILSLLDDGPVINSRAFALAKQFSAYYGCSLGEAIETFLPKALRDDKSTLGSVLLSQPSKKSSASKKKNILIHDQTRDQRWPIVITHIQKAVNNGKKVIVLVPETSFIAGTVTALMKTLTCPMAVFDKKLPSKKELEQWKQIRNGEIAVIVGTRSAIFAPVPDLGLIVIDEEENDAYKQEQAPHYRVHAVAEMRAKLDQCTVIRMSSCPRAETWEEAKREKWERITIKDKGQCQVQLVDMTNYNPGKTSILSFPLQTAIQKTLEANRKIVLFMNRLGFSTRMHCQECGFTLKCERCNVNLTFLYSKKMLACRHCNYKKKLPKICPECHGRYLRSSGTGIEKLESEVSRLYPGARIHHYDRQSKAFPKDADIIIATQAIFRRHDQWTASLAAILNFDAQMYHMDFRCGHKALALLVHLTQLAKESLLIQTRMMDNYCIKAIKDADINKFYREELKLRKELALPPYRHLIAIGLRGQKEDTVFEQSTALCNLLSKGVARPPQPHTSASARPGRAPKVQISDPHPDVNPKLRDKYRFTIIVKGASVKNMLTLIKKSLKGFKRRGAIITINVDP